MTAPFLVIVLRISSDPSVPSQEVFTQIVEQPVDAVALAQLITKKPRKPRAAAVAQKGAIQ